MGGRDTLYSTGDSNTDAGVSHGRGVYALQSLATQMAASLIASTLLCHNTINKLAAGECMELLHVGRHHPYLVRAVKNSDNTGGI